MGGEGNEGIIAPGEEEDEGSEAQGQAHGAP